MAKTIPMIITNSDILVKDRDTDDFKTFSLPGTPVVANIPFYHHYAAKISETQHYFKEFIKSMYGKSCPKTFWQSWCRTIPPRWSLFLSTSCF